MKSEDLQSYIGKYTNGDKNFFITKKSNDLYFNFEDDRGNLTWKIHFITATNFCIIENNSDFNFVKDTNGKIIAFKWNDEIIKKIE